MQHNSINHHHLSISFVVFFRASINSIQCNWFILFMIFQYHFISVRHIEDEIVPALSDCDRNFYDCVGVMMAYSIQCNDITHLTSSFAWLLSTRPTTRKRLLTIVNDGKPTALHAVVCQVNSRHMTELISSHATLFHSLCCHTSRSIPYHIISPHPTQSHASSSSTSFAQVNVYLPSSVTGCPQPSSSPTAYAYALHAIVCQVNSHRMTELIPSHPTQRSIPYHLTSPHPHPTLLHLTFTLFYSTVSLIDGDGHSGPQTIDRIYPNSP